MEAIVNIANGMLFLSDIQKYLIKDKKIASKKRIEKLHNKIKENIIK